MTQFTYVAVLGRNRTLFRCIFRLHYRVPSALAKNFHEGWGSYVLDKLMNTYHVYIALMSPTLNGSSALECFERRNGIKIRNRRFLPGTATYIWREREKAAVRITSVWLTHTLPGF